MNTTKGNAHRTSLTAGVVYDIDFRCTTPGPDVEEGTIRAYWTGEIDTWGKHTFVPIGNRPEHYLFRHEIVNVERVGVVGRR